MIICPICHGSYMRDHPQAQAHGDSLSHLRRYTPLLKCGICGFVLKKLVAQRLRRADNEREQDEILAEIRLSYRESVKNEPTHHTEKDPDEKESSR